MCVHSQDMSGVQLLQKKLNLLETDIAVHQEQIDTLDRQANQFTVEHHFDSEGIEKRQKELVARYEALQVRTRSYRVPVT